MGLLEAVAAGRAKRKCLVSKSKASPLPFLPVHKGRDVGAPDTIRTCDLRFRKPPLYPSELRGLALVSPT